MGIGLYILIFVVALAGLLKASDWFVESAEKIGLSFGISPFIIGVTIVAFGTSLPELASSIASVYGGKSEIVAGNVVGSNIANIALVLGIVAMFAKTIPVNFRSMDLPLMIGSALLLWFFIYDGSLALWEAIVLLVGLVIFLINSFANDEADEEERPKVSWKEYALLILGGALVAVGAKYVIFGIEGICDHLNIGAGFVAQTAVALGTSLPEVVVSISAARKGNSSIAVGNVIGSNIFNTYGVMGISRLFGPLLITDGTLAFSLPFMMGVSFLLAFMTLTGKISRWEGAMLLLFYIFFLGHSYVLEVG